MGATAPPSRAAWGVGLAWAALSVALVGFVASFATDYPIADDWELVPVLTGHRRADLAWLAEPHNEHRIVLPKLLHLLLARLTNVDFRAGMVFNAACLIGVALAALLTAGRVFGRSDVRDLFFLAILLHWGQFQNLLWSFQIQFLLSTSLALTALFAIVSVRGRPTFRQTSVVGVCLLALPLCGANGLALVPALALWLAAAGCALWRSGMRGRALVVGALVCGAVAAGAAGHVPLSATSHERPGPLAVLRTSAQFWGMGFGPIGETLGPLTALALLGMTALALFALGRGGRRPDEAFRAAGLAAFLGAFGCLALGIGWGRAHLADAGFANRYTTLAVPVPIALFFAWRLYGEKTLTIALVFVALLLWPYDAARGIAKGRSRGEQAREMKALVEAGATSATLAQKYAEPLYFPRSEPVVEERFEMMRRAGVGPFRR